MINAVILYSHLEEENQNVSLILEQYLMWECVHYLIGCGLLHVVQVSTPLCTYAEGKTPSTSPCLRVGRWPCQAGVVRNSSFGKHSHSLDGLSVRKQIGEAWQVGNSVISGFTWESFIAGVHSIFIMSKDIAVLLVEAASEENINHVFLKELNWFLGRKICLLPSHFWAHHQLMVIWAANEQIITACWSPRTKGTNIALGFTVSYFAFTKV